MASLILASSDMSSVPIIYSKVVLFSAVGNHNQHIFALDEIELHCHQYLLVSVPQCFLLLPLSMTFQNEIAKDLQILCV